MRRMVVVMFVLACCGSMFLRVPICWAETVDPNGSSVSTSLALRGSSWTDQFDETSYLVAAPDTVAVGDTVHVSVTARDPFYPDDMVAAPWSFLVDGANEDSGFWVALSDSIWEASYEFIYDSGGSHTFLFTAQDLGHGNGGHSWEWFEIDVTTLVVGEVSGVEGPSGPSSLRLLAGFPNPFDDATTIRYLLPEAMEVRIGVFDSTGRFVRALGRRGREDAGVHSIRWDGRDQAGQRVASGVYFYRLQAGSLSRIQPVVHMR